MSDFVKSLILAVAVPVATAIGEMAVDEANHRRAQTKASRARWEALMEQERKAKATGAVNRDIKSR